MEKTLQQQYILIKEGKGNKDDFLKSARRVFPEFITPLTDYKTAVNILKSKSILSESVKPVEKKNWFKIFESNLKEETYAFSNQELKEKSPKTNMSIIDVYNLLSEIDDIDFIQEIGIIISQRDWNNRGDFSIKQKIYREIQKHIDDQNIINDLTEEIYRLTKSSSKELNESIGVKNIKTYGDEDVFEKPAKEVADITKKANFDYSNPDNIDNVYGQSFLMGYYTEMKDPKNAGKTVDELKEIVAKNMAKDINYYATNASFGVKGIGYEKSKEQKDPKGKWKASGYGDLSEAKRPNISSEIKEIEKSNETLALEAKIKAIDEAIEKRQSKLSIAESEELAEMIDPKMVKTLQKEIKELEKYKAKAAKLYEKITGSKKQEVIDEDNDLTQY